MNLNDTAIFQGHLIYQYPTVNVFDNHSIIGAYKHDGGVERIFPGFLTALWQLVDLQYAIQLAANSIETPMQCQSCLFPAYGYQRRIITSGENNDK